MARPRGRWKVPQGSVLRQRREGREEASLSDFETPVCFALWLRPTV